MPRTYASVVRLVYNCTHYTTISICTAPSVGIPVESLVPYGRYYFCTVCWYTCANHSYTMAGIISVPSVGIPVESLVQYGRYYFCTVCWYTSGITRTLWSVLFLYRPASVRTVGSFPPKTVDCRRLIVICSRLR